MDGSTNQPQQAQKIRADFIPKDVYLSRDFLELEKEKLWPRVWQIACRVEEIPRVGDYVTYDIADDTIVVIRTGEGDAGISAYHNVCQHRGRRLVDGTGHATKFHCRFHGWQWNIDGSLLRVLDRDDWKGCPDFSDADLKLKSVKVGTWAGFVFINMDLNCEPLEEFLKPLPEYLDCFQFEKWRFRWYKTTVLPINWKAALEGFNEAYHVAATHPQILDHMGDDVTYVRTYGKHGMYYYPNERKSLAPFGAPSPRTGKPIPTDLRPGIVRHYNELSETLAAMYSLRAVEATQRLMTELGPTNDQMKIFSKLAEVHRDAALATGAGWPEITPEQYDKAGMNWHLFPNHVFLMLTDGSIAYRARPNGDDPHSCIFDMWSLVRYAPGAEPPLKREFHADWKENVVQKFGLILSQDFQNFEQVQRGMKSRGFAGLRTNPVQEGELPNMHRALYGYVYGDEK